VTILFSGLASVLDRTVFTDHGPITKKPLPLITGINLVVVSATDVSVPTGGFTSSAEGKHLTISGSPGARNDGTFTIARVLSQTRLRLADSNLDITDIAATTNVVVAIANVLRNEYEVHRVSSAHGSPDITNVVTAQAAVDLTTAVYLLNDLRAQLTAHLINVSGHPSVHKTADGLNTLHIPRAIGLESAILLANDLRRSYEAHRQDLDFHLVTDNNRVLLAPVRAIVGTGPLVGPFTWTLIDPRYGLIANDPSDVAVRVIGVPTTVDAVFGLLGAIVLSAKPNPGDDVRIDYDYLENPSVKIKTLNSFEYVLNQDGVRSADRVDYPPYPYYPTASGVTRPVTSGIPGHQYRVRSYLPDPSEFILDMQSALMARRVGWKYKAYERAQTAVLNDPTSLLLNVPSNRLMYPVLDAIALEITIRYDPVVLPQNSTDPWIFHGTGRLSLTPGGSELVVADPIGSTGPEATPPFFSHSVDLQYESVLSSAFRTKVDLDSVTLDGVFTGVGFGVADGYRVAFVGFVLTQATNLSSAISLANQVKIKFGAHIVLTGVHHPDDSADAIDVVDATDLQSLIILLNREKALFNHHLSLGLVGDVHVTPDTLNVVTTADAMDLATSVVLVNALAAAYDAHRPRSDVHYYSDTENSITPVKQIGILRGKYPELQDDWELYAINWTEYATYRLVRDSDGSVSLLLSGSMTPIVSVAAADLPEASSLDLPIDEMEQIFFGALSREAVATSYWAFVRANVSPLNAEQIGDNKSVSYTPLYVPELDPVAPWIDIGQCGFARVVSGALVSDSTASVPPTTSDGLGATTGAYEGYLRLEPILSDSAVCTVEFRASFQYWTFGISDRAAGVFIDDGTFATHMLFLQASPQPAVITGTVPELFGVVTDDTLVLSLDDASPVTVTFLASSPTVADVVARVNAVVGFSLASASGSYVKFTTATIGSSAKLQILSGSAMPKIGLAQGTYFGRDSDPEPRVSWFGTNFPDADVPSWFVVGDQVSELLNRTLRITDISVTDFRSYSLSDPMYVTPSIPDSLDWKLDARLRVLSYQLGDVVATGNNLRFCGALVNVDEGPLGKNVELELAMGAGNVPYVNILSYNSSTGMLVSCAEYPFIWNDGAVHTFNIFTSKGANLVIVLADGALLGSFTYSSLQQGSVSSLNFGSGANQVLNADLRTARSVVDWSSVCVFRDAKLSNPSSSLRRYVGLYAGGDPSRLQSYYLAQVDWSVPHTYRMVRDPMGSVSVHLDGSPVPVVSANYDLLRFPPASSSFLSRITAGRQCIAFGNFSDTEISRGTWQYIRYSLGKLTMTDRLVPSHHVLNQANVIVSPDHLRTKVQHEHRATNVWSEGTPPDDFMLDETVPAATILGEGTPPFPMTQDLASRGGLSKAVTPVTSIPAIDVVNTNGFLADFQDDLLIGNELVLVTTPINAYPIINKLKTNLSQHVIDQKSHTFMDSGDEVSPVFRERLTISSPGQTTFVLSRESSDSAGIRLFLNSTELTYGVDYYVGGVTGMDVIYTGRYPTWTPLTLLDVLEAQYILLDDVDIPSAAPENLPWMYVIANAIKAAYEAHRVKTNVHIAADTVNIVTASDAVDVATLIALVNDLVVKLPAHGIQSGVHGCSVIIRLSAPADAIYDCMRFFRTETGEEGHMSPFSDDHCHGQLVTPSGTTDYEGP
jgi:hypothetical protein